MYEDDNVKFTDAVECPLCGASIPVVKMDTRIIARSVCPRCGNSVLIEGDKPQA